MARQSCISLFNQSRRNFELYKKFKQKNFLKDHFYFNFINYNNVNICSSEDCTFKEEGLYYSYRNNQSDRRMITLIWRNNEE